MILNCNLDSQSPGRSILNDPGLLQTPAEVHAALFGQSAPFYLQVRFILLSYINNDDLFYA